MGKTVKNKALHGGDERNLYLKRLKATGDATNSSSESPSHETQREIDCNQRAKLNGSNPKLPSSSQAKSLKKSKLRTPTQLKDFAAGKHLDKLSSTPTGPESSGQSKMQSEGEAVQVETFVKQQQSSNGNGEEQSILDKEFQVQEIWEIVGESPKKMNGNDHDDCVQVGVTNGQSENANVIEEALENVVIDVEGFEQNESFNGTTTNNDNQQESNPQDNSVESSVSELSSQESSKNGSGMELKQVEIKLNDCMKAGKEADSATDDVKDMSFGRTLRNITSRRSLGRVGRSSPNSSLFVNTSCTSPNNSILDESKYLTSDLFNGSPADRKRKWEEYKKNSLTSSITKKPKTEPESSIFNAPFGLLKGWRRPVEVTNAEDKSLFKPKPANEQTENLTSSDAQPNKWCIIM